VNFSTVRVLVLGQEYESLFTNVPSVQGAKPIHDF